MTAAVYQSLNAQEAWRASDQGLIAFNFDHFIIDTATAAVAGTLYLQRVNLRRAAKISSVWCNITSGAATPTANQNFVGIYNSTGVLVASSAAGAIDGSLGTGPAQFNLSAPVTLAKGSYWVALLFNALTPPTIHRATLTNGNGVSIGTQTPGPRSATGGTGLTALPASQTPGTDWVTTNLFSYWVGLS